MLETIIVDDSMDDLQKLKNICAKMPLIKLKKNFNNPQNALDYVKINNVDIVFADVLMPGMDGLTLQKEIRYCKPDTVVMLMSTCSSCAIEALKIKTDYFLIKPVSAFDVEDAIKRASLLIRRKTKHIKAVTFGRFNIKVNGETVVFRNAKAKELLALLIDHEGGLVTMEEAIDKIWGELVYDEHVKQRYRTALMQLRKTLLQYEVDYVVKSTRGGCMIEKNLLDCDYFELLADDPQAKKKFDGSYMFEYSWAEETCGYLCRLMNQL